jgi:DNA-binding transcriptional regulator YiaG
MDDLPPQIQARRAIEDRAAKLGASRRTLEADLNTNTAEIRALLGDAEGSGVSYDQLAQLIGVSRQTLYHWREDANDRAKGTQ